MNSYTTRLRNIAEQLDFLVEEALEAQHEESYPILESLAKRVETSYYRLKTIINE